ncbi:GIY-YIG nuclease family protein [Candidatus Woesebacteria bacterium]|nr:GIY-YIG nuclease family protein [Candidatus Woesebacteria bacterium]
MKSKALQMLVPEGNPNGMKIIELAGWSGKCFVVPRQNLKELKDRAEINQPGLYLLFGVDESSSDELVYIGESENFYSRIESHDSNKDFWNVAVIFIGNLNRAFVKYLEYKATTLAHEADRMIVQNKVQPQENTLSDFEKVGVENYFENMQFILGSIGYEVFDTVVASIADKKIYILKTDGAEAKAQLLDDGSLNVIKGSTARIRQTEGLLGWSSVARQKFIEDGTFTEKGDGISYVYTKDVLFKSPSAAAATTCGRSANGWTAWKDEQGNTLDENLRK